MHRQGSPEWYALRRGRVTASRIGDILTQPRSKADRENGVMSATARSYMVELISEMLTGVSKDLQNIALDWGSSYEPEAREFYELMQLTAVTETGFHIDKDDERAGGSPDGLVGEDGMIEIKCPFNSVYHVGYLMGDDIPRGYFTQMQWNMKVLDRKWCDFVSYDPRMAQLEHRMKVIRVERDDKFIRSATGMVASFLAQYQAELETFGIDLISQLQKNAATAKGEELPQ